jgi:branched-chain amino acid transport system permease protein
MNLEGLTRDSPFVGLLAVLVLFAVLPFIVTMSTAGQVIVLGIFAMGYNVMFGFGGEMSFGHASFYGLGAFGMALLITEVSVDPFVAMAASPVIAATAGVLIGAVSLKRRGIYFAMISLALAQMVYYYFINNDTLSGRPTGLYFPSTDLFVGPFNIVGEGMGFYVFAIGVLLVLWLFIYRLLQSPYGMLLRAVRTNEQRAKYLGISTYQVLLFAFTISALIAGVAGTLYFLLYGFITPDLLFWSISGQVIIITILGGAGSMNGPILGAFIFVLANDQLTEVTEHWPIIYGLLFVAVVLLLPGGMVSLRQEFSDRLNVDI